MPLYPARTIPFFNIKDSPFGCKVDGSTDDTTGLASALAAANAAGGGVVSGFNGGTCISGNQPLYPNVIIDLQGGTIKLKNGANTDLFSAQTSSINLSAAANSGSVGTLSNFSIRNGTLDGNKANQSSGTSYPLRFYGYNFVLRDVEIARGYSGGALIDWNGGGIISQPSNEMESLIDNVKIHDCNGVGLQMGGPHDSRLDNVLSFNNTSHGFHFAPNAAGMLLHQCHPYKLSTGVTAVGFLIEALACKLMNCMVEGSDVLQVAVLANDVSIIGGQVFNGGIVATNTIVGIQLGQNAGGTPIPGQINQSAGVTTAVNAAGTHILTKIEECDSGAIKFVNESHSNVNALIYQTVGTALIGTPSGDDNLAIQIYGLTADGTFAKIGGSQIAQGHLGINTTVNDGYALLVAPDADAKHGITVYPHSSSQSAPLLATQNSSFTDVFTVDKSGNVAATSLAAGQAGTNAAFSALISPTADNVQGLSLYPHSSGQSVPLLSTQNSLFASVFTVDLNGNTAVATLATAQSATTPDPGANGTITTANTGVSRVTPAASRTGVIMQAGTVAGQKCTVVNNSASFTITFATAATSNVAQGTSLVIAALGKYDFTWDSIAARWY